jgi:hypothetical protein
MERTSLLLYVVVGVLIAATIVFLVVAAFKKPSKNILFKKISVDKSDQKSRISVDIHNAGKKNVVLQSPYIRYKSSGKTRTFQMRTDCVDVPFPHIIHTGENLSFIISIDRCLENMHKSRFHPESFNVQLEDDLGLVFRSQAVKFM